MKNIGIFGSFGSSSIGDEAILKGIVNTILRDNKDYKLIIYTMNVDITKKAISVIDERIEFRNLKSVSTQSNSDYSNFKNLKKKKEIYKYIYKLPSSALFLEQFVRKKLNKPIIHANTKDLDILIFAGGNILMDKFIRWPLIMDEMIEKVNCPIYFLGVGAGPISTFFAKYKFKNYLERYYISTRDEESLLLLKTLSKKPKRLELGNDLAFGLNFKESVSDMDTPKYFGVSILPYNHPDYWPNGDIRKYSNYIINMRNIIDYAQKNMGLSPLFVSTNYPTDLKPAMDIYEELNVGKIIKERQNVDSILNDLHNCEFIIGTRLHSLILSSVVGKPIIGVGYQPKVKNFLKRYNLLENYIDIKIMEENIIDTELIKKFFNNFNLSKQVDNRAIQELLVVEIETILGEEFS